MSSNWWNKYRQLPYKSGGRDHSGVDCYGLVSLVYSEQLDITLPDYSDEYADASSMQQAAAVVEAHMGGDWEEVTEPRPFDVIILRVGKYPCHIGLVYRPGWMIHCLAGTRVTCERFTERKWRDRIVGFRRYSGSSKNLPVPSFGVPVSARPNPLSMERMAFVAQQGASLTEIIAQTGMIPDTGHAYVGYKYIPRSQWDTTFPRDSEMVTFAATLPAGGDDKNIMRVVATVVVMAVAAYTGGAAAYAMGFSKTGLVAAGVTAAVSTAGMLAVNALVPPVTPDRMSDGEDDSKPSYIINSTRNRLKPWGAIPVVLGTVYNYAPPLAAKSWTEIHGNDAYHRMIVIWGYGILQISDLRIGDTPVHDFDDIEVNTIPGYTPGDSIPGWASTVHEASMNVLLEEVNGYSTRTVEGADEINIIFTFPQLVKINDDGDKQSRSVDLEVGYRKVGTSTWYTSTANLLELDSRSWLVKNLPSTNFPGPGARKGVNGYYVLMVHLSGRIVWRSSFDTYPGVPSDYFGLWQVKIRRQSPGGPATYFNYYIEETNDIRGSAASGFNLTTSDSGTQDATLSLSSGSVTVQRLRITASQTTAVRRSLSFNLPEYGDYEVRAKRVTADSDDTQISDEVYWSGLQTIVHETPIQGPAGVTLAISTIRIRANEQLSGGVDEFNGTVQSVLDYVYDTSTDTWVYNAISSQPGDLMRHVLQSDVMARSQADSKINLTALEEFVEYTTPKNFSYNNVLEEQHEVMSLVREICAAGRAMPRLADGTWSVVIDEERNEYAQTFIAENIWDLSVSKTLDIAAPHGWRVTFRNELQQGAVDERIVYDDGYDESNASDIQNLELPGVTHPDAVWQQARFHIAQARLRPRKIEFYADVEHIVCQRGDLIELNHPTPLFGAGSGRVKSVQKNTLQTSDTNTFEDTQDTTFADTQDTTWTTTEEDYEVTGVILTDKVSMESGKSYGARFRLSDGTRLTVNVDTDPGDTDTLVFSSPIASGNPHPEKDDICAFGEVEKITTDLLVKNIFPIEGGDRYSARLECVDYSPELFDADSGPIPDFEPNITSPIQPERELPAPPRITQVLANEFAMVRNPDGSLQPRIVIDFEDGSGGDLPTAGFRVRYKLSSEDTWESLSNLPEDAHRAVVPEADEGRVYDVRIASVSEFGTRSSWVEKTNIKIQISAPPAPTKIKTIFIGGNRYLSWNVPTTAAPPKYEIRRGSTWGNSQKIGTTFDTKFMIGGPGLYWVASRYGSKYSDSQINLSVTNWGVQQNIIAERDEADRGWPGDKTTGVSVDGSNLILDGSVASEGTYTLSDSSSDDRILMTSAAKCKAEFELSIYGEGPDDDVYSWSDVYDVNNVYGAYGDQVDATVDISVQGEDDTWGDWESMETTEYYGKGFTFRLNMYSEDEDVNCGCAEFNIQVDVPDRSERKHNISVGTSGESIVFDKEFNETPIIHVQIINAQDGDQSVLTNESTTGFDIAISNSGSNVSRNINWRAQGY